jgi:hypothetical protein
VKKLITDVENEGFEKLFGETVTLFCLNYFYNGKLIGVNDTCVLIESPKLIYETGKWTDDNWKNAQNMGIQELYVQKQAIEAFAVTK